MNVHFSYKIAKTTDLENLLQQQTDKLNRLLRVFRPELVHLKGSIVENSPSEGFGVSLNLRLPSGQMAAQESSGTVIAAVKAAFSELANQLKKHKDLLRNQHNWPRRRGPGRAVVETVPFEQTVAAVKPEAVSTSDVYSYIDANLPRLRRFVAREVAHRENEGQLTADQVSVDDAVSEAIANALDEQRDKPERMRLEPWLYRLAVDAISHLAFGGHEEGRMPLERSPDTGQAHDTEEPIAEFSEPQERLYVENAIVDSTSQSPEDIAARNELIDLVERSLRDAGRDQREAFILFTIEGFTVEEIADITNHLPQQVRAHIQAAREHLQQALPMRDPLKDKLVEYAKTA
jgi:RNA polymerase sigma factor (sigma-70 family)